MARNEEKANNLLNRWTAMKADMRSNGGGAPKRRPYLSTECDDLGEAEKWRIDVIREISRNIGEIQNAGLGEHRIRDINDTINKLLREKYHWQKRIKELGGADYNARELKTFDADGHELPGGGGYKYFGAAKDLPGVRELFQAEAPEPPRRTRAAMYKNITVDYFGFRDEDSDVLVEKEAVAEKRAIKAAVEEYEQSKRRRKMNPGITVGGDDNEEEDDEEDVDVFEHELAITSKDAAAPAKNLSAMDNPALKSHVPVPSQSDMQAAILEHRKAKMMEQYLR